MLKKGNTAPLDVVVYDQNDKKASLKDCLGSWVVLYFYPKDDTPGCTTQAKGFRDHIGDFQKQDAIVIGVSKDTAKKHQKFINKYDLNFQLWVDEDHRLMEAFGTWGEKKFMGKTYMGTTRSTFLINPEGNIVNVWEKVKPAGHAEEVLQNLVDLSA